MDRNNIINYIKDYYAVSPEYPWYDLPNSAVFRRPDNAKWFALIMDVARDKLHLSGEGIEDVINLKCDPELVGALQLSEGYLPAYHMNKDKWITVMLNGTVPYEDVTKLIDLSYALTAKKSRK